ncbi:MAG: cytochrome c biogenesis CcdA family protein [Promethearchaeota archaeon]
MEVNLFIAFFTGLIIGGTPCILLMLSVFGSSMILIEDNTKFLKIMFGLLSGLIVAYVFISIIFLYFFWLFGSLYLFKFVFAAILIFIGIWQIIECKKEESIIFGTPKKIKLTLKNFVEKNSGLYSFLVGVIFVFIKTPCFGGVYLALLYNIYKNPIFYIYIAFYLIGMLIPVIIIFLLLRLGLESEKINEFRLKNRTLLRIISGAVLIFLAIYLLILNDIINALF